MTRFISFLFMLFSLTSALGQDPFEVYLEPMTIPNVGGLQSFAFGQSEGEWLIVGGRLDGLHRRQPWASFDTLGHNTHLMVIDPVQKLSWKASLSALPASIREQLSSTNMEFEQEGDYLYLIGGYGYSHTVADHITYPYLSALHIPNLINAIKNASDLSPHIRQIPDELFAVTGGHLDKMYDTYYLTGGQRFDGRYNPMDHPTFTQVYTDAIRIFRLQDDGVTLTVTHLPGHTDSANLHRRDYNVTPQILPSGQHGLTAFSGVFQQGADIPFMNCVNIDSSGYTVNNSFSQYYNHYHCANIPLYSENMNEMHTVFFGGIAQYYESGGNLIQDDEVPFVKTIARVTRNGSGTMTEYKLPIEMPALLGAGSEFIPISTVDAFPNGVLKLDELTADTTMVGYIYGGINSSDRNIFFTNTGTESSASDQVFKVYLIKGGVTAVSQLNAQSINDLRMQIYPDRYKNVLNIDFYIDEPTEITIRLSDNTGKLLSIGRLAKNKVQPGKNHIEMELKDHYLNTMLLVSLQTDEHKIAQKISWHK